MIDAIVEVALLYSLWFCRAALRRLVRLGFVVSCVFELKAEVVTAVDIEPYHPLDNDSKVC